MLSSIRDRNIFIIYGAVVLLGIGYGTSISVLSLHLTARHIEKLQIAYLATSFAFGIMAFSIPVGWAVQRFGAKPVFAAALAGYCVCVTTFPYLMSFPALAGARFFDGAFSVGVWVSAETALLQRSDRENKGLVMSIYALTVGLGYFIGPLIASLTAPRFGTPFTFGVAGVFAAGSTLVILVFLAHDKSLKSMHGADDAEHVELVEGPYRGTAGVPNVTVAERSTTAMVIWRVKTSCFGTFAYGYFQASVVLFLPIFLMEERGVAPDRTIYVTAFFAAGMLLMSLWAGRLGDRYGHLLVMRVLGAIGAVMVACFVLLPSFPLMCAAVTVAGATLASISPVSLALQGVVTPRAELGRANGFYNAAYAIGMLLGPPVSGLLFTRFGGAAMLFHLAALWATFVAFTLVFASDDPRRGLVKAAAQAASPAE